MGLHWIFAIDDQTCQKKFDFDNTKVHIKQTTTQQTFCGFWGVPLKLHNYTPHSLLYKDMVNTLYKLNTIKNN